MLSLNDEMLIHIHIYFFTVHYDIISIFHGYEVLVEKSIMRVTVQHHEAC